MQFKGKLTGFKPTLDEVEITITGQTDDYESLERLQKSDVRVELKTWREGRSKNANAYFHVLSDKLADAMRMSKPKMKNYLLFHYGQKVRDENGDLVIIKTNADEEQLISRSDIHMWYLKDSYDGTPMYVLLEHSRFYSTLEMSILIDGTVAECKAVGIETLTPAEIQKMKECWGVEI